jgi:hypothetical protein
VACRFGYFGGPVSKARRGIMACVIGGRPLGTCNTVTMGQCRRHFVHPKTLFQFEIVDSPNVDIKHSA